MRAVRFLGVGILTVVLTLSVMGEGLSAEKKFPTKPITVVIGFAPGDTDNILRPFVEKMPEYLGQPMTFVYKPGAAGSLGAGFVASSKPDGYTLVGTSQSSITVVPHSQKDVGYTWESFAPVCYVAEALYLFAVKADSPWKTMKDFVADARKEPGKLTYSSSGAFGLPHIGGEMVAKAAGMKLKYIPSTGSTPAVTAVLGGHVDAVSTPATPVFAHIQAGTMRALAVFTKDRSPFLADTPTFLEMGYPVSLDVITGFLAPKGTPKDIVDTIASAAQKVAQDHKAFVVERLGNQGQKLRYGGPADYTAALRGYNETFSKVIKDLLK